MKKFIITVVIIALALASVYFFIPNELRVSNYSVLQANSSGVSRAILQKEHWNRFWNGKKNIDSFPGFTEKDCFVIDDDTLRIKELLHNAMKIEITNKKLHQTTLLTVLPLRVDSTILNWSYTTKTSLNPFVRLQQYTNAVATKQTMSEALSFMKIYFSRNKNIYTHQIIQTSTVDTLLITKDSILPATPSTDDIYKMVDDLYNYADQNKATPVSYPYLNVSVTNKSQYKVMVALPINKHVSGNKTIFSKHMLPGKFLTMTIQGGEQTIKNAHTNMQQYIADYSRVVMALPFEILVTNRKKETDTSKWITRLYVPVM